MGEAAQKVAYGVTELVTHDTLGWHGYVGKINEDDFVANST